MSYLDKCSLWGVEHGREVKSRFQMVWGVIHPLGLFMSSYLLAAIGINTVLHFVLKSTDNQKAGFPSGFVARKTCLSHRIIESLPTQTTL